MALNLFPISLAIAGDMWYDVGLDQRSGSRNRDKCSRFVHKFRHNFAAIGAHTTRANGGLTMRYWGYDIDTNSKGILVISLNGKPVSLAATVLQAYKWIDKDRQKLTVQVD